MTASPRPGVVGAPGSMASFVSQCGCCLGKWTALLAVCSTQVVLLLLAGGGERSCDRHMRACTSARPRPPTVAPSAGTGCRKRGGSPTPDAPLYGRGRVRLGPVLEVWGGVGAAGGPIATCAHLVEELLLQGRVTAERRPEADEEDVARGPAGGQADEGVG